MRAFFFVIATFAFVHVAWADSPLTSTDISQAYAEVEIVQRAAEAEGELTPELMAYLYESENPLDVKIALINALGWGHEGQHNADLFFAYLSAKEGFSSIEMMQEQASGEQLICLAYLKALDNYFDVATALQLAEAARNKGSDSFTLHIIHALIAAQHIMDTDWCKVYQLPNNVRKRKSLTRDMRTAAVDNIFEYVALYKSECK